MSAIAELEAGVVGTGLIGSLVVLQVSMARGGPSDDPVYPTLRDGQVENVRVDAVALSNRERRWVEVPA